MAPEHWSPNTTSQTSEPERVMAKSWGMATSDCVNLQNTKPTHERTQPGLPVEFWQWPAPA